MISDSHLHYDFHGNARMCMEALRRELVEPDSEDVHITGANAVFRLLKEYAFDGFEQAGAPPRNHGFGGVPSPACLVQPQARHVDGAAAAMKAALETMPEGTTDEKIETLLEELRSFAKAKDGFDASRVLIPFTDAFMKVDERF